MATTERIAPETTDMLTDLLDELGDPEFEILTNLIRDFDEPPPLDPRLVAFIDDYAKFCADLYARGFVPDGRDEPTLIRQYLRAYDGRRKQKQGSRDRSRR